MPKIKKLSPSRYILTTSVDLSPDQADELKLILEPFVLSTGDIYGRDRLNSLLGKHPEVERRHNKLWLESTGILESILHAGVHAVSKEELERTLRAARLYVKNESFEEALKILKEKRVCIISGIPGIGKTTLARMLLLYFYRLEYELIKVESDISEARDVGYHKKPRFYYYDDFLGQTSFADKLNKNEDQRILDFMSSVHDSKQSVMVLTTREYILNQAKLSYERIDREKFDHQTCIIDLSKYSRKIRAQILYNHLYFSDLPKEFIDSLVSNRGYLAVVDHRNYNPRLIEYLTSKVWLGDIEADKYAEFFLDKLNNPKDIWSHAFNRQIALASQDVLRVLTTLVSGSLIEDLRIAFESFHSLKCAKYNRSWLPSDFERSLKELDGTFIHIRRTGGETHVQFQNPSIRDFMQNLLLSEDLLDQLLQSCVFFEQVSWFCFTLNAQPNRLPVEKLRGHSELLAKMMVHLYDSRRLPFVYKDPATGSESFFHPVKNFPERLADICLINRDLKISGCREFVEKQLSVLADILRSERASLLLYIDPAGKMSTLNSLNGIGGRELISAMKEVATSSCSTLEDYENICRLGSEIPEIFSESDMLEIGGEFDLFGERYPQELMESGLDDPENFRLAAGRFEEVGTFFQSRTSEAAQLIRDHADDLERDNQASQNWDPDDGERIGGNVDYFSNHDLDSMFGTLKE